MTHSVPADEAMAVYLVASQLGELQLGLLSSPRSCADTDAVRAEVAITRDLLRATRSTLLAALPSEEASALDAAWARDQTVATSPGARVAAPLSPPATTAGPDVPAADSPGGQVAHLAAARARREQRRAQSRRV